QPAFHYRLGPDCGFDRHRCGRGALVGDEQKSGPLTFWFEPLDLARIVRWGDSRPQFGSHDCPYALRKALNGQRDLAVKTLLLVGIDADFGDLTGHQIYLLLGYPNFAHVGNLLA